MSRTAINDRARAGRSSGGVPLEPDGVATDGTEGGPPRRNARAVAPPERPAAFRRAVRFALLAPALALALGGVLLGSVPAEAQTATVLVKKPGRRGTLAHPATYVANALNTYDASGCPTGDPGDDSGASQHGKRAQGFTTGAGYSLECHRGGVRGDPDAESDVRSMRSHTGG